MSRFLSKVGHLRPALAAAVLAFAGPLTLAGCAPGPGVSAEGLSSMRAAAERGEAGLGVPADLVLAVAWAETRWSMPAATDAGETHGAVALGAAGIHPELAIGPLAVVSERLGVPPAEVEARLSAEPAFGVLAASAVLRALAEARFGAAVPPAGDPAAWRAVVADYAGLDGEAGAEHAEYVLDVLRRGMEGEAATGERLLVPAREVAPDPARGAALAYLGAEYPSAAWSAASTSNYTVGRGGRAIRYVVIHTTQGSYAGAISWFRNPSASVSAHYVVRSSDGAVTQMLHHADTGWHAGNWTYNQESIGIEHEGYVADPGRWYTDAMYRASAALTRWICERHGIPMDRAHIIGHNEVPGATHTDPGSGWDWDRYMTLVRGEPATPPPPAYDATAGATSVPAEMTAGGRAVAWVEFTNTGASTWSVDLTRLGTSSPQDHASPFYDAENWLSDHRASGADHSGYATGAVGRFSFMIRAPEVSADTTVTDTFRLVHEGVAWFGPEITLRVLVHPRPASGPVDGDADGWANDLDCDDADPARSPGTVEVCGDGVDQDCDGADATCGASDAGGAAAGDGGSLAPAPGADAGPGATGPGPVGARGAASGCSASPGAGGAGATVAAFVLGALIATRRRRMR